MAPASDLAAFTTVFRAAESHRVRRNRQPVSCTACQRRKSKCDRQKPCGACEKRGDEAACRFGPGRQEVQTRLAKLEEMVKDLAAGSTESGGGGVKDEHEGAAGPLKPAAATAAAHSAASSAATTTTTATVPSSTAAPGDGVQAKYRGATSWEALVESIHDIQNVLEVEDEMPPPEEEASNQEKPSAPDIFLGDAHQITMQDVLRILPDRAEADKLVTVYFNAKFLAVPFIHVHHFRRRYEAFWADPSSTNFTWLSMVASILSIGAMIANVKGTTTTTTRDPKRYMALSARCLMTGEYLKAKAFSVEALMMFAHARNVLREDSDSTIWAFFSLAVRLAQRRGYHLDAASVSDKITPFEAEMRRRTWFMVQSCDLLFSFQLGMPPMIYQSVCSAGHPLNLLDHDFDEGARELPPPRPETDPTPILAWRIKSLLCRITRHVTQHVLAVDSPSAPYGKTAALNAELEEYYAAVPACFRVRPIRGTSFTDEGHTIMHRLVLELVYRKTVCVLHRPFLAPRRRDDGQQEDEKDEDAANFRRSRDICCDSAMRILHLHLEFDREVRPGGRMWEDRFMVSSLTLHDFLMAAMIICLDLSESTDTR